MAAKKRKEVAGPPVKQEVRVVSRQPAHEAEAPEPKAKAKKGGR